MVPGWVAQRTRCGGHVAVTPDALSSVHVERTPLKAFGAAQFVALGFDCGKGRIHAQWQVVAMAPEALSSVVEERSPIEAECASFFSAAQCAFNFEQ